MRKIHLWPEEPGPHEDQIEVAAVLERTRGTPVRLFFRLPIEHRPSLTPAADPFVVATVFHVLSSGADLEVHGTVSPSLLRGLEDFQAVWCRWLPDRYRPFDVVAEAEREEPREKDARAVMVFSGGLDSCCTAWRHTRGNLGRRTRQLEAAMMAHGFDIPVDQNEMFARALVGARAILGSIGVPLIPIVSNIRVLRDDWEHVHGAALAACMHLFAKGYSTGLIANSHTYEALRLPWGSNPLTDPMLSSTSLSIVHDGCELARAEKAEIVADWHEARDHLRVCWEGDALDRNCGTCLHCLRTALNFASVGRPIPPGIPVPSPADAVERLRSLETSAVHLGHHDKIVAAARDRMLTDPWIAELESFIDDRRKLAERQKTLAWNPFSL